MNADVGVICLFGLVLFGLIGSMIGSDCNTTTPPKDESEPEWITDSVYHRNWLNPDLRKCTKDDYDYPCNENDDFDYE